MLKVLSMSPTGALKSIPLNALPPEAWTSLTGGDDSGDAQKLYENVPWLRAGVDAITEAVASIPCAFHRLGSNEEVENPEFPFKWDQRSVFNEAAGDYLFYAAIYWHKGINRGGRPTLCKRLHPSTIKPKFDDMQGLVEFERRIGGRMIPLAVEDVAYKWEANRKAELGPGVPRVKTALKAAGILNFIDDYSGGFFGNGAVESTLLFVEGTPSDGELDKVEARIKRVATGIRNAFRLTALRFKPEAVKLGSTPDKLALPELTDKKREDIATALRIPQSILFSNAANHAVAREDNLSFYDKAVVPLAQIICEKLSEEIFKPFGLVLKEHHEKMELYQQLEAEKSESLSYMIDRKVITGNEFRDAMGFEKRDDPAFDEPGVPRREGDDGQPDNDLQREFADLMQPERAELRKMQRWFERRLAQGKSIGRAFETQHLSHTLKAAIEGALTGVSTVDESKHIFLDALQWQAYP